MSLRGKQIRLRHALNTALFTAFVFMSSGLARAHAAGPRCPQARAQQVLRCRSALTSRRTGTSGCRPHPRRQLPILQPRHLVVAQFTLPSRNTLLVDLDLHLDVEVDT
eukprot:7694450-Heterocapsa_arctica.AAC.1